jgi:hypothetical protein
VLRFTEPSDVEIMPGGVATEPVRITLGRESTVSLGNGGNGVSGGNGHGLDRRRDAELHLPEGDQPGMAAIALDAGHVVGLPVELRARTPISLAVRIVAPKKSKPGQHFDLDIVQRNAKRVITGGIRIRVQVVEPKR